MRKYDGQIALMYVAWYGPGRSLIEGLRTDSLYLGVFRVSQVIGFVCFILCGTLLVLGLVRARRRALAGESYESCYAKCTGRASIVQNSEQNASVSNNKESEEKADGTEN